MMKKEETIDKIAMAELVIELLYDNDINIDGFSKEKLSELHSALTKLNHGIIYSKEIEL